MEFSLKRLGRPGEPNDLSLGAMFTGFDVSDEGLAPINAHSKVHSNINQPIRKLGDRLPKNP